MVNTTTFGDYTITYKVTDSSNHTAISIRIVTVADTKPVIHIVGGHMHISQGAVFIDPGYTAIDDVDGDITDQVQVLNVVDSRYLGIHILTYTVTDSFGNTATAVRAVHVVPDSVSPIITLHGQHNMTIPFNLTWAEPGYTATDDTDGNITSNVIVSGTVDTNTPGTYTITYTVSDAAGNQATQTRTITVSAPPDTIPPTLTLHGSDNITLEVGSEWVEPGYTATDDTDGNITSNVIVSGTVDTNTPGTYTITYTVSDAAGNQATQTRTITIEDTKRPVLTLVTPRMTISQGTTYV